jgi:hypothetical protein
LIEASAGTTSKLMPPKIPILGSPSFQTVCGRI